MKKPVMFFFEKMALDLKKKLLNFSKKIIIFFAKT
jgi:hypothetical protein